MNRLITAALSACLLASTAAVAGLNPGNPGLPQAAAWGVATTDGVTGGIANNAASAICVDCHSRNPTNKRSAGKYGWQAPIASFRGSHYVGMDTHSGGGVSWASPTARTGGEYFHLTDWATVGGRSKYGVNGGATAGNYLSWVTDSTLIRTAVFVADNGTNYDDKEIICESCHSVITNVAGGRNLLNQVPTTIDATTGKVFGDTTAAQLGNTHMCETCHGNMTRADAHGNNSPDSNNHHVVSIQTDEADIISNAKAGNRLLWTRANSITGTDNRRLSNSLANPGSYTGQMAEIGYRILGTWVGGLAGKQGSNHFNCTDCHAYGHFGRTDMGGRILRSGEGTESGKANLANTDANYGIERLNDQSEQGQVTIFEDDQGYCQGCHVYGK